MLKIKNYYRLSSFILSASLLLSLLLPAIPAQADSPGNINAPFDPGTIWNICQGYNNTRGSHSGTSSLSLDLTDSACNNGASGKTVRAPFAGTIAWYSDPSGSLCINSPSGRSVMLTHIDSSLQRGNVVTSTQAVGSIAAPGLRQNAGVSHLHLQAWSTSGCSGDNNRVPFDEASNMRICGAPNLYLGGPNNYNNGEWSGTSFIAQTCSGNSPIYRLYSPVTRHHLFTSDANEAAVLQANRNVWNYEGIAFNVGKLSDCTPGQNVYRFYSEMLKVHMYTLDENEKNELMKYPVNMWRYEGIAFCSETSITPNVKPVYRFYSDLLRSPHYTVDENEKTELMKYPVNMWRYEGIAYYAF